MRELTVFDFCVIQSIVLAVCKKFIYQDMAWTVVFMPFILIAIYLGIVTMHAFFQGFIKEWNRSRR